MASRSTSRQGATASTRTRSRSASSASPSRASGRSAKARPARSKAPARAARSKRPAARPASRTPWLAPLLVITLIVVAAWSFYPVARVQYREQREKARLESELAGLKERNSRLRAEVDRLKTPEGVEEVARESLGLVKEGENVYVVLDGDEQASTPTTEPSTAVAANTDTSGWQRVLDMIFGFE